MNLKPVKQNWTLVIGAAVFVLLLAGVLGQWQRVRSRQRQVEEQLQAEQNRLANLRAARPFPSRENLERLRRDKNAMREWYEKLAGAMGGTKWEVPVMPPVAFSQLLAEKLAFLRKQARLHGVVLPENFAFGFSRYVGTLPCHRITNPQERDEIMRQLGKQLQVIETLSTILTTNGISELKQLRRVEVEPGTGGSDALTAPLFKDPQGQYTAMPFEVQFACRADSLRQVLNALSSSPLLLNVRRLQVSVEGAAAAPQTTIPAGESPTGESGKRMQLAVTMVVDFLEMTGPDRARQ